MRVAAAIEAVVIGASAGAVQALLHILPGLPATLSVPILIVVHVPSDRSNALVTLYQDRSRMRVKEAEDKETVTDGTVYFAPSDYHLLVEAERSLALSSDEAVHHSRPAIDVLFETAADAYGPALAAIILTGANQDGADGLRAVAAAGASRSCKTRPRRRFLRCLRRRLLPARPRMSCRLTIFFPI